MTTKSDEEFFCKTKENVAGFLLLIAKYATDLHKKYPSKTKLLIHAKDMLYLRDKVKAAAKPNLTNDDYDKIVNFTIELIETTKFNDKLYGYTDLIISLMNATLKDETVDAKVQWFKENVERFHTVNLQTEQVREAIRMQPKNYATILSVMQAIMSRKEVFDFIILEYLKAVVALPDVNKYDVYDICSVESKIWRRDHYETDVTAIRACIAHSWYRIEETKNNDYMIYFKNNEKGWAFERSYTREQFLNFFDDYVLLGELFNYLLLININLVIIQMNLMRRLDRSNNKS